MQNSHVIILTALIILGIFSAGCTSTSSSTVTPVKTLTPLSKATAAVTTVSSQGDFTFVEDHSDKADGYIGGTIKSNTDKTYSYVQVSINLYDASGAQIGSTIANTNNLEPYGTWKYKAPVLYKDVATYKVMTVTGM
jgi:hypothetical protein